MASKCSQNRARTRNTQVMKKTILLVANDSLNRERLSRPLRGDSYELTFAENARQALARCTSGPPDLLVVDLDRPDEDGLDSRELIKRVSGVNPGLPVILITGRLEFRAGTEAPGVRSLAAKPFDGVALLRTVDELVTESPRQRIQNNHSHNANPPRLASNNGAIREPVWQRALPRFAPTKQPRNWGLNE